MDTATYQSPIGSQNEQNLQQADGQQQFIMNGPATMSSGGTKFLLAPGGERETVVAQTGQEEERVVVMDYTKDFPELPGNASLSQSAATVWNRRSATTKPFRSNIVTQMFHLPMEERATHNFGKNQFGNTSEEQQKCNVIASVTDTTIELSEAKDHTLTILITGTRAKVEEARSRIVRDLQTQSNRELVIPKDHHRVIIGKDGSTLRQLESETDCRIIVPGRDSVSDTIKVFGPREAIEKAVHHIQLISDEQSKLAQEHLVIPRMYYPWIRGAFNSTLDRLSAETGAKINIPPTTANSQVITVTGEKEGVYKAAAAMREIFHKMESSVKSVTCNVARAQHRYVIGHQRSGLAEILRETNVSVEVPSEEEDSDTITLRGPPDNLGEALSMVYKKASSVITAEVDCPAWLHKFIIGPKGHTLQQILPNKQKVIVDFEDDGKIYLQGAPEEVKIAQEALRTRVNKLESEMAYQMIKVHPNYHRHVIGKGGSLISKIKSETGVHINIPNESTNSDEILIEGERDGVSRAAAEILELVKRMENERSRDMVIEQRLHKLIIGAKGEKIQKLRDEYPSVLFGFPEPGRKSDIVSLRGDKQQLDACYKALADIVKSLQENNFQVAVPIFKDFHKHIVGKGGAKVRQIRDETTTRIDLPGEGSAEDKIVVTGKKQNVLKAVDMLRRIQNELASIVNVELKIAAKVQSRMLGGGRRLIQDIQEECGGVQIKFPEKNTSDTVTIRGPKDDVEKAEKLLTDLAKDREVCSFEDSVTAKPELHRFLIGRGGQKINKMRENYAGVRILFPREADAAQDKVHLIGKREEVAEVKKQLEKMVTELNETVEVWTDVPNKWHKHFIIRNALVLREVQEQCGGVQISFPKMGSKNETKVSIKGARDCCEAAKQRIGEIVQDLENQISLQVNIAAAHHRSLLANRGQYVQDICAKYNVQIKFPDRDAREESGEERDQVTVSGLQECCVAARDALLALVPVSENVSVPFEYHGPLIGPRGEAVRALMHTYDVSISIPPLDQQLSQVTVQGSADNVRQAVEQIVVRCDQLKAEHKDRELRSFKLTVPVPVKYHQRLIGPRGAKINQLRDKHEVQINIPKQMEGHEPNENIVISGYEAKTEECRGEIEAMIAEFENLFSQEITLDPRVHARIIGQKGRNIRKLMDEFGVEINLRRSGDSNPDLATICGPDEDSVYDCIDHLRGVEQDFALEMRDSRQEKEKDAEYVAASGSESVEIKNGPWQAPDTTDPDQFPAVGVGAAAAPSSGVWTGARPSFLF